MQATVSRGCLATKIGLQKEVKCSGGLKKKGRLGFHLRGAQSLSVLCHHGVLQPSISRNSTVRTGCNDAPNVHEQDSRTPEIPGAALPAPTCCVHILSL